MDNKELVDGIFGFSLTQKIKSDFTLIAKWANVIAITGAVNTILSLVVAFAGGSPMTQIFITICNLILYMYLYRFSFKIKLGIESHNQFTLNDGLKNLNQYFKIYAIVLIVTILAGAIYYFVLMNSIRYGYRG